MFRGRHFDRTVILVQTRSNTLKSTAASSPAVGDGGREGI